MKGSKHRVFEIKSKITLFKIQNSAVKQAVLLIVQTRLEPSTWQIQDLAEFSMGIAGPESYSKANRGRLLFDTATKVI
jgi:hypothetical protein